MKPPRHWPILLAALSLTVLHALLAPSPLEAHPLNVAYADIAVEGQEVEIALSVNLFELDLLLALDRNLDALVSQDELDAMRAEILDYLRQRVAVSATDERLPVEAGPFRIGRGSDGKALFETTLVFRGSRPLTAFTIRCEPLTDLGPNHKTLARITREGKVEQFVFQQGVLYEGRGRGVLAYLVQFLHLGVVHIFTGYDHILFLLGLLLVGQRLFDTVKIVTSFTLAHSVTLSLAALSIVNLPTKVVEAGIALSIVYIALENLLLKRFDTRWLISFFFGLVHGFGFATVLMEMRLPRSGLISSLFAFNLGVEVGQVVIVLLILPLLGLLSRTRGYAALVRSTSVGILTMGLFWFYQRAF